RLVAAGPVARRRGRPASRPPTQRQLSDRRTTMSRHTRALIVGATLAAMQLAGMTAVAHPQPIDDPTNSHDPRRPPPRGRVGEPCPQPGEAADVPAVAGDARRPPTERQVGESW